VVLKLTCRGSDYTHSSTTAVHLLVIIRSKHHPVTGIKLHVVTDVLSRRRVQRTDTVVDARQAISLIQYLIVLNVLTVRLCLRQQLPQKHIPPRSTQTMLTLDTLQAGHKGYSTNTARLQKKSTTKQRTGYLEIEIFEKKCEHFISNIRSKKRRWQQNTELDTVICAPYAICMQTIFLSKVQITNTCQPNVLLLELPN